MSVIQTLLLFSSPWDLASLQSLCLDLLLQTASFYRCGYHAWRLIDPCIIHRFYRCRPHSWRLLGTGISSCLILRLALWMEATFFSITYTSNKSNILPLLSSTLQFHFLPQLVKKLRE